MFNMNCSICKANKKNKVATHFGAFQIQNHQSGYGYTCAKHFKAFGINKKGYFIKLALFKRPQ